MAPKTLTVDKGTNTDDSDEYLEIKTLTEQNSKLILSLEAEREKFRFFLNGISRNLASHQQSLSDSLKTFHLNMLEQRKVLSNNVDIFKSITVRDRTAEKTNKGSNGWSEDRNETPVLGANYIRSSSRVAQIFPMPRPNEGLQQYGNCFKRQHS